MYDYAMAGDSGMGCLFHLFFDIIADGLMDWMSRCCVNLILLVLPSRLHSERNIRIISNAMTVVEIALYVALLVGVIMLFQNGALTRRIGRYLTAISLVLLLLPIVLWGIVSLIQDIKIKKSIK